MIATRRPGESDGELRLRQKADRAWEMAGLARADRDHTDAARWTAEARKYEQQLRELRG